MSTIASTSLTNRSSLLRSIVIGGAIMAPLQFIAASLVNQVPFFLLSQYMASGALGNAAFEGGLATALLGLLFHILICFVLAGVFILSADRIPLLRRHAIVGSLLFGLGVYIVMNLIVLPLSAAPSPPPPTLSYLIVAIIEHVVVIGLPLGINVRRNAG